MVCSVNTIDSNATGLRIAKESCLKVLPATPVWNQQEPNTYATFGGQVTSVARDSINNSRQNQKGVVTDQESSAGYNQDFTLSNSVELLQGFLFADAREKLTTKGFNAAQTVLTSVVGSTKTIGAASGLLGYPANSIVLTSGFTNAANNGRKTVASNSTSTSIVVTQTMVDEMPTATAKVTLVGKVFPAADLSIAMNGTLVRLVTAAGDFTTYGLMLGEWIYIGGDTGASAFTNNYGFARVSQIAAGFLEFDKVSWAAPAVEAGTGKTIELYFGTVIRNELDPALIKRSSYQLERTLGSDADGIMSEYIVGAVPNEYTLNLKNAAKISADMTFVACSTEHRAGIVGVKGGNRPSLAAANAFNTTSDVRFGLSLVQGIAAPTRLFAFVTDVTLKITNNVTPNKAIAVLGAFDHSVGMFDVSGDITAYFSNTTALEALSNNADVTLDIIMVDANKGMIWDVPLMTLGDGVLNVTKDKAITLPIKSMAAQSSFGHTLLTMAFNYLPSAAA